MKKRRITIEQHTDGWSLRIAEQGSFLSLSKIYHSPDDRNALIHAIEKAITIPNYENSLEEI